MTMAKVGLRIIIKDQCIPELMREFKRINYKFDQFKEKPKYFPNIRFVVLKMLERYGAEFQFKIPLIRTKRKLAPLEDIWDLLVLPK